MTSGPISDELGERIEELAWRIILLGGRTPEEWVGRLGDLGDELLQVMQQARDQNPSDVSDDLYERTYQLRVDMKIADLEDQLREDH